MARSARASGVTLIEAMAAMSVLVIGSLGLMGLHRAGVTMNADARVMTRATAIAQDLVGQMQMWDYANDPRLVNTNAANDADFADGRGDFEYAIGQFNADHAEAELEGAGPPWLGLPSADVQNAGFQRYWNVAEVDLDANGAVTAKRIAVIVRWEKGKVADAGGQVGSDKGRPGRRIVLITVLRNPAVTN